MITLSISKPRAGMDHHTISSCRSRQGARSAVRMAGSKAYDVVVVGGGAVGHAASLECAKAGKTVLVLDRFTKFNGCGSSFDYVRMFRVMYTENYLADLAKEAKKKWQELERESGQLLVQWTGLLNFGNPKYGANGPEGTLMGPIANLDRLKLPYEKLTAKEIMATYNFRNLPDTYVGIFSPDCGIINVPLLLRTVSEMATRRGAEYREHAQVTKLDYEREDGVMVSYLQHSDDPTSNPEHQEVLAAKVIVTAGAYTNDILKPSGFQLNFDIWEMVYAYYSITAEADTALYPSMWFRFEDDNADGTSNLLYGFPPVPWGPANAARIAVDAATRQIDDPAKRRPGPSEADLEVVQKFIAAHCKGVTLVPNLSGSCLQTNLPDNDFVLDFLPGSNNKVIISCAGWAMKFVPLFGEILAYMATHGSPHPKYDISHFKITRPHVLKQAPPNCSPLIEEAVTRPAEAVVYTGSAQPRRRRLGH